MQPTKKREVVFQSLGSTEEKRGRRWRFSGCGYSRCSAHSERERVTYWAGCLSLCFSVSSKPLCATETIACFFVFFVCKPFLLFLSPPHSLSSLVLFLPTLWASRYNFVSVLKFLSPWSLNRALQPPSSSSSSSPSRAPSIPVVPLPCFPVSLSLSLPAWRETSIISRATVTAHATGCRQHLLLLLHFSSLTLVPPRGRLQARKEEHRSAAAQVKICCPTAFDQELRRRRKSQRNRSPNSPLRTLKERGEKLSGSGANRRVENEVETTPVAPVWLENSRLDSAWLPHFATSLWPHFFSNTNGFQEEVEWAEGAAKGAAVRHPGWFICCVRDIWAGASHHQGAVLRVVEEAQLQEGGAQLSAATGKMFQGHRGPSTRCPKD